MQSEYIIIQDGAIHYIVCIHTLFHQNLSYKFEINSSLNSKTTTVRQAYQPTTI